MLKKTRNLIIVFFLTVLLGFGLMVFTYMLPSGRVKNNIANSDTSFSVNDLISGYHTTHLDNYTDSLILGELAYKNPDVGVIKNAMGVYGVVEGTESFQKFISGQEAYITTYERYWHGNLAVLKPLFIFLKYQDVQLLMFLVEFFMLFMIVTLMRKNKLDKYIIPFLISVFLIHPETIGLSFQYSAMYCVLLLSLIILLQFKDKIFDKKLLIYYFMIIGMATSFFDFLTYPAITFGVPIVFYYLLEKEDVSLKDRFKKIILYGILWCIGYLGMWFSKWVIASIVFQENCIKQAINIIFFRSSAEEFSRLSVITTNLGIYKHYTYLIVFLCAILYYGIRLYKNKENISKERMLLSIPLLLICLIPFAWYLVVSNHSYIHYWMTYRELIILFFAGQCLVEYNIIDKKRSDIGEKRRTKKSR